MGLSDWGSFSFKWTTVPGNSEFVVPFDSTRMGIYMPQQSLAAGSAYLAPGPMRGKLAPAVIRYTVKCTGFDVTLDEQLLTGNAGTSADWESQGAEGTAQTITAGTGSPREFKPLADDWRILITAGASGPTAIVVKGKIFFSGSYGG